VDTGESGTDTGESSSDTGGTVDPEPEDTGSPLFEVCGDGIDNDEDGLIDRESPVDDGFDLYRLTVDVDSDCTMYPGLGALYSSCSIDESITLEPLADPTASFTVACSYAGALTVDVNVTDEGVVSFVVSSTAFDSSTTPDGTLCDGEMSGTDEDSVTGGTPLYWTGDYEAFGWVAECGSYWTIDVEPL
jgi:hypothetical protein